MQVSFEITYSIDLDMKLKKQANVLCTYVWNGNFHLNSGPSTDAKQTRHESPGVSNRTKSNKKTNRMIGVRLRSVIEHNRTSNFV